MFKSCLNRGFTLKFENNLTISVQFGTGNYCSRRNFHGRFGDELKTPIIDSVTAEIAIWDKENKWFNFGSDEVKGYVTTDEVAKWIAKVQKAKDLKSIRRIK